MLAHIDLVSVQAETKSRASLIADVSSASPGTTIRLGIYLEPAHGWHTYWKNPGDSGGPTTYNLKLPAGWTQEPAIWPLPIKLDLSGVVSYGYSSPVLLVIPVKIPKTFSKKAVNIVGRVKWLTCTNEICKPADQNVALNLLIGPSRASTQSALIADLITRSPNSRSGAKTSATLDGGGLKLKVLNWRPSEELSDYYFFPASTGILDHSKPEKFSIQGFALVGELPKSPYSQVVPTRVTGVLISQHGNTRDAINIDVAVQRKSQK